MRTTSASTKTPSAYGTTHSAALQLTLPTAIGSGNSCSHVSEFPDRRSLRNGPRRNAVGCRYFARRLPSPRASSSRSSQSVPTPPSHRVRPDRSSAPSAHLADGSTVWLQSGSTLACDGSFGAESRNVKLRGEGFFDIAKDPERPFTVEVEGLRIRVHGTKFNVNTSLEDRTVAVSLVEGSVALDSGKGEQRQLYPGEIACYNTATQKLDICRGNVELESCWAAGKLVFERQSLGEICRYLSRWYDIRIDISPALARNYAYTFTITDEPLEAILRIMSRINPIVYTFSDNRSVSISEVE